MASEKLAPSVREQARQTFLAEVKQICPDVLASLSETILPHYQALSELIPNSVHPVVLDWPFQLEQRAKQAIERRPNYPLVKRGSSDVIQRQSALFNGLCLWGQQWNLAHRWLFGEAIETLHLWNQVGEAKKLDWACFNEFRMKRQRAPLVFEFTEWEPKEEPFTAYKSRAMQAFRERLDRYQESRLGALDANALIARRHNERSHYAWLVEFQVNRKGYSEIAGTINTGNGHDHEKTVREAVKSLASLIGLKLRTVKRGRPSQKS
jgi:hypothetical protein